MTSTKEKFISGVMSAVLLQLCCQVHSKTYSIALLGLESRNDLAQQYFRYKLILINENTVNIGISIRNINGPIRNLVLSAYGETTHALESGYSLNGSQVANKTIMISSALDFTLQVFSQSVHRTEGFIAISLEDLLGPKTTSPSLYEYSVTTYCPNSGICQMAVSTFNDATVKVTFPDHLHDIVFCIGETFFRSSRDSLLELSKFDAVQIETAQDLTGTRISSSSPIVVYVGSRNLSIDGLESHTLEQLPTISQWGTQFGVASVAISEIWSIVIVSARMAQRTKVEMSGFGTFILDGQETLTRRLVTDENTIISADKPIQVVQVSGFMYYYSDVATVVSMAVVSAREHGTDFAKVTCGSRSGQTGFIVINENWRLAPQADGMDMHLVENVVYSDFQIYSHSVVGRTIHTVTGDNVSGIVNCENGALFSLRLTHTGTKKEEEWTNLDDDEIPGICIEGEFVEYKCDSKGRPVQTIEDRDVTDLFVLKLRVKTCGHATVQFTLEGSHVVNLRLTSRTIGISLCDEGGVCNKTGLLRDHFNSDRSCQTQIAWYWFQETTINGTFMLRVGTGPVVGSVDAKKQQKVGTMSLPSRVKSFSLSGLFANASFHYDLESASGCAVRVSDWRCEDIFQNCSLYGKTMCKDIKYQDFSKWICPRYCGKCKLDGYGRKFVGVFPPPHVHSEARIYIKPSKSSAFIAVATENSNFDRISSGTEPLYFTYIIPDTGPDIMFWIVSDVDLLVTVFVFASTSYRNTSVTYNVFPTDTFARQYQTVEENDIHFTRCDIVTDEISTNVKTYIRGKISSDILQSIPTTFSVDPYKPTVITGSKNEDANEGTLLKSNKPISVFCESDPTFNSFNRLLPLNVLGTQYRIPKFDMSFQGLPPLLQLYVQGLHSYTTIKLIGDTMQTHILSSTGEKANFTLNPNFQYEVISSQVITVGLHVTLGQFSTLLLMPPVECFSDKVDTAIPVELTNSFIYTVNWEESTLSTSGFPQNGFTTTWGNNSAFGIVVTQLNGVLSIVTSSFAFEEHDEFNEICEVTKATVDDGIDNDCDGIVDEEICCGRDADLDGGMGEDYWIISEEPQEDMSEPECIPIDKPENQCWTVCKCPCSWVENLLISSKLSRAEFLRLQQIKALVLQKKLRVNKKDLVKVTAQKISAEDPRQSAANVGYVGVVLFMLAVAFIVFLDISAIKRDLKVLLGNLRDGLFRFIRWITCRRLKLETNHS